MRYFFTITYDVRSENWVNLFVQDPAVQQAARSAANAQNTLEDYNPFEGGDKKPQTETSVNVGLSAAPPSVQSAPNNFEPTITNSGHHISTAELQVSEKGRDNVVGCERIPDK